MDGFALKRVALASVKLRRPEDPWEVAGLLSSSVVATTPVKVRFGLLVDRRSIIFLVLRL